MSDQSLRSVLLFSLLLCFTIFSGCAEPETETETGSIVINLFPDSLDASWALAGPSNYTKTGTGDLTISNRALGQYTITWADVDGWITPDSETRAVTANATATFAGDYTEPLVAQTIVIDPTPDSINAPWTLSGPDGYSYSGTGDQSISDRVPGEYVLDWGAVSGWLPPASAEQMLSAGGTITFNGVYSSDSGPVEGFVLIPPNSVSMPAVFTMGSDVELDETPHQVTLTGRFYMASTVVTNAQYVSALQWAYNQDPPLVIVTSLIVRDNLDGSTEELFDLDAPYGLISFNGGVFSTTSPDRPVLVDSWYGSVAYCDWLSLQEGLTRAYDHGTWSCNSNDPYGASGYRLSTEAEWEFACRAGTITHFNTGDCLDAGTEANYRGSYPYPGCSTGPYLEHAADVGSYPSNQWSLFEMHGNAWEWCNDWWYGSYSGNETNPDGPESGLKRVLRGGNWSGSAQACRSARRFSYAPNSPSATFGFRPVRSTQ